MTTAIPPQADSLVFGLETYPHRLPITDLDYNDSRYPTISSSSSKHRPAPSLSDRLETSRTDTSRASWIDFTPPAARSAGYNEPWAREKLAEEPNGQARSSQYQVQDADLQAASRLPDGAGVYSSSSGSPYLPHDAFDSQADTQTYTPSAPEQSQLAPASRTSLQTPDMGQRASALDQYRHHQYIPSSPKHPSLPASGAGGNSNGSPIVPMSAGPSYASAAMAIPISPKPRAYAQQPTYITPASAPSPINPVYSPPQMPKEEVCVECAMRDQDMADVDVTSPGVWRRDSDADFEELLQRDLEDEAAGTVQPETSSRPRARGGRLTVENLKLWLAVNPKEPTSRQQTLDQYVKAQRSLLEAEALAHARAMRESRQLDDKMRDTYSQLRRSAYELGSSAQPMDDSGGVRIKAPRSASTPNAMQLHNREVTLLENGMIVEHVDVRMEEREERERKKREERRERSRVRKTSRGSRAADVMSVYSLQTPLPTATDSGFFSNARTDSRYSQSIAARPSSVMTAGGERPATLPRAQSQASFSDMQSVGSGISPRRSRFFGLRNLSSNWRSQESFAPSGSMIDMHVALQREQQYFQQHPSQEFVDIGSSAPTLPIRESWARMEAKPEAPEPVRASKKPKGLKKIWKLVTGSSSKSDSQHNVRSMSIDRTEDDTPLAPPPPLSYLVDQGGRRHSSTTSLPSIVSPNTLSPYANSPPTAPSSLQPSPTSSRKSADKDHRSDSRKSSDILAADQEDHGPVVDTSPQELRGRMTHSSWTLSSTTGPTTPPLSASPSTRPVSAALRRDKSLPPLPGEHMVEFPSHPMPEGRPQTMFTYDPRSIHGELEPPQAPFRTQEARRQSFGGIGSKSQAQTMPIRGALARGQLNVPPFLAEEKYGEFGASSMSVQWPAAPQNAQGLQAPPLDKPRKRKSKFGLSALFGKKASNDPVTEPFDFSALRASPVVDSRDSTVVAGSGYASPLSANSHAPRMSVMSRKNLDELVDQDPEFIAYRYPSNDQRLDLLR